MSGEMALVLGVVSLGVPLALGALQALRESGRREVDDLRSRVAKLETVPEKLAQVEARQTVIGEQVSAIHRLLIPSSHFPAE